MLPMQQSFYKFDRAKANLRGLLIIFGALVSFSMGCSSLPKEDADAQPRRRGSGEQNAGPASVDVGIARSERLPGGLEYVGTTQPYRQISLRAQVEGQLLRVLADVGDAVKQGQVLAQIDDKVLTTTVIEATAEVAALESEVAQARAQVSDALRQVESARLQLQQAQADSVRIRFIELERSHSRRQSKPKPKQERLAKRYALRKKSFALASRPSVQPNDGSALSRPSSNASANVNLTQPSRLLLQGLYWSASRSQGTWHRRAVKF
jgi:multidrug efflux pump subunit AcrA (membrane-fusion protein)